MAIAKFKMGFRLTVVVYAISIKLDKDVLDYFKSEGASTYRLTPSATGSKSNTAQRAPPRRC